MTTIYLASPLGFAGATRPFMATLAAELAPVITVINPWDDQRFAQDFLDLENEPHYPTRVSRLETINFELGRANTASIDAADGVFAILDGVDVDSGTAAEIGYGFAQGKRVCGLRTDFRLAGDNLGSIVNLQVEYFIKASGGAIVTTVPEFVELARAFAGESTH